MSTTPLLRDPYEAKHAEVGPSRGAKDDYKQQQSMARSGIKQRVEALEEQVLSSDIGQQAKQMSQQAIDKAKDIAQQGMEKISEIAGEVGSSQPREIHRTSAADFSFSSIPDTNAQPVAGSSSIVHDEETQPLLQPKAATSSPIGVDAIGRTGDPCPASQPSMMGMETARGIDEMQARTEGRSLYSMWKHGGLYETHESSAPSSSSGIDSGASKPSVGEQASAALAQGKEIYSEKVEPALLSLSAQAQTVLQEKVIPAAKSGMATAQQVYTEQIAPTVQSGIAAAQEKISQARDGEGSGSGVTLRQRVAGAQSSIVHAYEDKVPAEQRAKIAQAKRGVVAQLRLAKNKLQDVWERQEPVVRRYAQRAMVLVRQYKMEIPLMALTTLLVLWASMSLIGWAAFPSIPASQEQVVLYHPHTMGPELGPDNAGTIDRLRSQIKSTDGEIMDGIESIKMRAEDGLGHIKDAMPSIPSMESIKLRAQDSLGHIKDAMPSMPSSGDVKAQAADVQGRVNEAMPSMDNIKSQAADLQGRMSGSIDSLKAQAADLQGRVSDAMPSMDEVKMRAADLKDHVADAMPSMPSADSIKAKMPDLGASQAKMPSERTILSRIEAGLERMKKSELGQKVQDRVGHAASLLPEQVSSLRVRMGDLVDRLTPAQQHFAYSNHADVLSPEDHVIEWKDNAGHVKEGLDL